MRRSLPLVLVVVCLGVPAAAATAPGRLKKTNGWIEAIAMDGPRVAYAVSSDTTFCHKLFVWNVQTEGGTLVSGPRAGRCGSDQPHGQAIRVAAVAGSRVAWIRTISGNTEADDSLYTSSLARPAEKRLRAAIRTGDTSGVLKGSWIGGLVGSGTTLAVNTWTTDATGAVTTASLRGVGAGGLRTLASGKGTMVASSADLGRIAVLRSAGTVGLYSAAGRLLRTFQPGSPREVALRKDYLVVLTGTKTLEIYDSRSGALVRMWPLPAGASHLDVHSGVAVYSVWRSVHALQLTTGRDVVLATARRAIVGLEIEAPGVVYAFNTVKGIREVGNLVFVPFSHVSAAVS